MTKYIYFNVFCHAYNYNLINNTIQRVSLVNDLGFFFDTKLKFNDHVNKIKNKAS